VGPVLLEYRQELPPAVSALADELARISKWLRKESEFALHGDVDLVPTAEYGAKDARRAIADARTAVGAAEACLKTEGGMFR